MHDDDASSPSLRLDLKSAAQFRDTAASLRRALLQATHCFLHGDIDASRDLTRINRHADGVAAALESLARSLIDD